MKAYKTKLFNKWFKKEKISDKSLFQAINEIEKGLIDANLGGSVYKKRIAKTGAGKSGGFRTILAFKSGDKMFFMYGFSKNNQSNISGRETVALKKLASELLNYSSSALKQAIKAGELIEVNIMSDLLSAIHKTAQGLHDAGVMKKATLREFDALCLPKIEAYTPEKIKEIRNRYSVSQAVFAAYLNTTSSTIQKWEQGKKKPNGVSLKLLSIVDKKGLDILL